MKLQVRPLAVIVVVMAAISAPPPRVFAGDAASIEAGKKIAFDRKAGNCMACHQMEGAQLAGNIGPPLIAMKARFPDKSKLRLLIWDMTKRNKNTMMPPFGRHRILSESDIDAVTDFIHSL